MHSLLRTDLFKSVKKSLRKAAALLEKGSPRMRSLTVIEPQKFSCNYFLSPNRSISSEEIPAFFDTLLVASEDVRFL